MQEESLGGPTSGPHTNPGDTPPAGLREFCARTLATVRTHAYERFTHKHAPCRLHRVRACSGLVRLPSSDLGACSACSACSPTIYYARGLFGLVPAACVLTTTAFSRITLRSAEDATSSHRSHAAASHAWPLAAQAIPASDEKIGLFEIK